MDNEDAKPLVSWSGADSSEITHTDFYLDSDTVQEALWSLSAHHEDSWEPTGFVDPDRLTSSIGFVDGTRVFTITPVGSKGYSIYVQGKKFVKTAAESVTISDIEGVHYVYFDRTGTLRCAAPGTASTRDLIHYNAIVSILYWDADNNQQIYFADERHGISMSGATHYHFHDIWGCQWESGLGLVDFDINGDGDDATAAQFGTADGEIHDEDLRFDIDAGEGSGVV